MTERNDGTPQIDFKFVSNDNQGKQKKIHDRQQSLLTPEEKDRWKKERNYWKHGGDKNNTWEMEYLPVDSNRTLEESSAAGNGTPLSLSLNTTGSLHETGQSSSGLELNPFEEYPQYGQGGSSSGGYDLDAIVGHNDDSMRQIFEDEAAWSDLGSPPPWDTHAGSTGVVYDPFAPEGWPPDPQDPLQDYRYR